MLKRKITSKIERYLQSGSNKMLIIDGARQIGKSYIIREILQPSLTDLAKEVKI